ncbi:hypothetical protein NLI96_g9594 [Meripilus lineatus]|uniref:SWIM-type domain-containing protein n=1 Tax=Meripilus lineatus TaxID=2056292 RepID=A0AAD5UWV5_9APHY|nr:hypothetical protein NLI96_g9594 [Physisporinus lineatus]
MSHNQGIAQFAYGVIESLDSEDTEDVNDYIERLLFIFPESLLLAALDMIDRENIIKFTTPWGYSQYQAFGSTATYNVFPRVTSGSRKTEPYCTCPSFAFSVMLSKSEYMCKHILAVMISSKLSKCPERSLGPNDLAKIVVMQCSNV